MGLTINKVTHRHWRQACRKCNREYAEAKKKYSRHRSLVENFLATAHVVKDGLDIA